MATQIRTETLLDTLEKRLDRMEYDDLVRVYGRIDRMQLRIVQRMGRRIALWPPEWGGYDVKYAADELLR